MAPAVTKPRCPVSRRPAQRIRRCDAVRITQVVTVRRLVLGTDRGSRWPSIVAMAEMIDDIGGKDAYVSVTTVDTPSAAIEITIEAHDIDYSALAAALCGDRTAFNVSHADEDDRTVPAALRFR